MTDKEINLYLDKHNIESVIFSSIRYERENGIIYKYDISEFKCMHCGCQWEDQYSVALCPCLDR